MYPVTKLHPALDLLLPLDGVGGGSGGKGKEARKRKTVDEKEGSLLHWDDDAQLDALMDMVDTETKGMVFRFVQIEDVVDGVDAATEGAIHCVPEFTRVFVIVKGLSGCRRVEFQDHGYAMCACGLACIQQVRGEERNRVISPVDACRRRLQRCGMQGEIKRTNWVCSCGSTENDLITTLLFLHHISFSKSDRTSARTLYRTTREVSRCLRPPAVHTAVLCSFPALIFQLSFHPSGPVLNLLFCNRSS